MTTLVEHIIVAGAENLPPMLEKSMYDSWASRIRIFIKGKKHGRMMLDSIDNGPLVYPTVEENRQTRPKKYFELTKAQQLQDDCDVQATNIILHGLSPDVYALVNHQEAVKDIWDRVKMLMKGTELSYQERESRLYNLFDKFAYVQGEIILAVPMFQQGEDPNECITKAMEFLSVIATRGIATTSKRNVAAGQPRVVKCYNYQGEGHMMRQCTQPKRPRNVACFKEKLMLAEAQEAAFQTDELDAYDSDCDDLSSAKAVLMANLSSYDPEVLSEVPYSNSYLNDMVNQDVQEMKYSKQTHVDDFQDNEIHSGSNIISYSQYLQESQDAVIQDTNPSAPNDLLVLSLVEQMIDHVAHLDKESQTNKMVNESLTTELERYKERTAIFEQRFNTCPSSPKPSGKLVAVTPMNKGKIVRFAAPVTSLSNIPKQTDSLKTKISNKPLLASTLPRHKFVHNSFDDMLKTSPVCLLSKASNSKSCLWHRRLSHLNFGTLNKLAKDDLARGILKLKFQKDHLSSACALRKSKKSSHQPKAEDTNQEKLYLLYMDLCGPMRVDNINMKNKDLGKPNVKADIGIFVGYTPTKKAFRIYNRRTHKIMETIHVTFDELTAMASEQFGSGPGLQVMTPATSCSGLVLNIIPQQPFPVATAPRAVDIADSPITTKFKMSMMGHMPLFLGLQISYSPKDTPMVEKNKLYEDLQGILVDATLYRGMIGSLMYLTSRASGVELYFIRAEYQLADIFTKPLPRERFNFLIEKLEKQHVAARDDKWVPFSERVKISSTNNRLETTVPQKEETFQVVIDLIKNSTCFKAFTISADVLEIFMQQFWYSIKKLQGTDSYEFLLANKKCIVNAKVFRTILDICPRVEGVDFTDVPDDDTTLTFLRKVKKKVTLSAEDNIISNDPDAALELAKSIKKTKAEEARQVYATHARIMTESLPKSAKKSSGRSSKSVVIQDTPSAPKLKPATLKTKLKGTPSLTPKEQEAADIMQALTKSKKISRRQPGTRGSNERTGSKLGAPDESTVVSATLSEGTGIKQGVPDKEKDITEEKDDKDGDADDEGDDHIRDTQDADDEDVKTESDKDDICKYKIRVCKDEDEEMINPEVDDSNKGDEEITDAAKADAEKTS
uniref:Integrase, catalytic region, zinc finger, CCHC-type, peptidase aspartic, catalytic n=1 Tax=Tanacetum cinerariifolium TaxID=118510 RepID=A0A6L2LWW5_TANCI|nr:integrase, catalytic region, zinc finger, CCHC-type, peptidase aspartic, catalytic [Tanacetum cinerariifolium]